VKRKTVRQLADERVREYSDLFTHLSRQNLLPVTDKTRASKLGSRLPFHVCHLPIADSLITQIKIIFIRVNTLENW
jgi:hypothetical protein